ncbi:hypothetical protein [Cloacibacillus sp. An23]|uniref:hypothetical protein n=1 Tax=Cloacibacillus sp. An23 TaxID=1965591 RepID=UPI000B3831AF|nr:hypothetical protein [Cloacibacillus sp. An23]OUO94768.1 hypothetical protein B5F39_02555 [Cloacibacillus sp. An23]
MGFEGVKETPTAVTVSGQRTGVFARDTTDILTRILTEMEFFEGFRAWCGYGKELEWRLTA